MKEKYKKENLDGIVRISTSVRDVCRNLGLCETGNSFKTVKKYIELHNIDTSHFLSQKEHLFKLHKDNKISIDEILIENSTYNNNFHLKKRLREEKLLEYKCTECGNEGEWLGKELVLQLDHINGISNDNRIENLRFLCPNCHTQTETFGTKK